MADKQQPWCCVCGVVDPPSLEVCPASELHLTHLIAYGRHARALEIYDSERAVAARAAMSRGEQQ